MTPAHVLAVYAEPLVAGRRVALLGPEDPALVDAVLALGARLLYVYDPRPSVEAARKGPDPRLTVAPLRAGDLGVREGAFDLALVPDLTLLGDPEASLAYLRRLVGGAGVALVASKNRDAREPWTHAAAGPQPPTYTELYDLCALQFAEVRMVGVAPFAAYAVAEFAPEREPSIAFDASLVTEPDPPEWFVAVASQSSVRVLEAYEIVQIPRDAVVASVEPVTETGELEATRRRLAATEQKLHEAEARAGEEVLRAERLSNELRNQGEELRKLRERAGRSAKDLDEERRIRQRVENELEAARATPPELAELRERTLALEAQLIEARTQLATPRTSANEARLAQERDAMAAEIASLRAAREQTKATSDELRHRLAERERELEASLRRAKQLEDRLEEQLAETSRHEEEREAAAALARRVQHAEALAARLDAELGALQTTHEHDVAQLEAALRVAGEELRRARTELVRRERMVRELVAQIEELQDVPPGAPVPQVEPNRELVAQLDLARRELARFDDEVRARDRAIAESRSALEAARRDLEIERARTEQLARDAARREAALQTSSWRIAELEKLGAEGESEGETRVRLEGELDALRRALAQEHARVEALERTLSASDQDELARARARLEEQAAMIAQLSAELASRQG